MIDAHGTALRCVGLVKRYEALVAVAGIDLTVPAGECFGLLGPNGAGKTTTVEIFEGLLAADEGRVEVLGLPWRGHEREIRERIGIQLQETQFSEKLTVIETLTLFRSFYRQGHDPEAVLRSVALEEKRDVRVRKLSGGQKQRLSVACALVSDPEIVFFDEPTTGLDPQSRRQLWDIIGTFRARGKTVVLTTHYMDEAEKLCDRVAILDHGRVIALDTPARLIATLGAEHVVQFRTEAPPDLDRIRALDGVGALRAEDGSVSITVAQVHRTVPVLLAELDRQGARMTDLTTHHASLEDVFVSLTGRHLRE